MPPWALPPPPPPNTHTRVLYEPNRQHTVLLVVKVTLAIQVAPLTFDCLMLIHFAHSFRRNPQFKVWGSLLNSCFRIVKGQQLYWSQTCDIFEPTNLRINKTGVILNMPPPWIWTRGPYSPVKYGPPLWKMDPLHSYPNYAEYYPNYVAYYVHCLSKLETLSKQVCQFSWKLKQRMVQSRSIYEVWTDWIVILVFGGSHSMKTNSFCGFYQQIIRVKFMYQVQTS